MPKIIDITGNKYVRGTELLNPPDRTKRLKVESEEAEKDATVT